MINQRDMMAVLEKYRGNAVVIPTMSAGTPWEETSHLPARDMVILGAMGKASSIALGVALGTLFDAHVGYGAAIGLLVGAAVGVTLDARARRHGKVI